ncbi:hypothetical protein [Streptomyces sp. NPDC001933]|uniref:hypothetical protein n=1 Tax=Streptomyces sp. NPDC001933 TaxID=3364626 RepID=UPI0036B1CBA9
MPITDICEAIAAVLYPQLQPAATAAESDTDAVDTPSRAADQQAREDGSDAYTAIQAHQTEEWSRIVGDLTAVRGWGEDPLLHALDTARRRREQVDADVRLLIAFGREFISPRPYEYSALARASGLTQYLVRKAYTSDDVDCIHHITGLEPRKPTADLEEEPVAR